jgi:hypothetical protein
MKRWHGLAISAIFLGLCVSSAPALAQQKTIKACQEEWRTNKAANQEKGITEKAFVTQCRAEGAIAQPASTPAAPTTTPPSSKTVKACQDEWRANRAAYQAEKVTEKAYVEKCRAGEQVALPSTPGAAPNSGSATAAPPPSSAAPPPPAPSSANSHPGNTTVSAPPPTAAGEFRDEASAKAHCASDLVVWANLTSKIYHFAGHKSYGTTKSGAYMCEKEATAQGFRAARREKRPAA